MPTSRLTQDEKRAKQRIRWLRWFQANKEKEKARLHAHYVANKEAIIRRSREWYKRNKGTPALKEQRRLQSRQRIERHKAWAANNRERYNAAKRKWSKSNQNYYAEWRSRNGARLATYVENRRGRIKTSGVRIRHNQIEGLYVAQCGLCASCKIDLLGKYERDHIMPLHLGGLHVIDNIQLLCKSCNRRKGRLHPDQWAVLISKVQ